MKIKKITSLTTLLSFIVLIISSIVLYIMPHGRVAYWVDWHLWGLTKSGWDNIHINCGILFLAAAFIHIILNWNIILAYFKQKTKNLKYFNAECIGAIMITAMVVTGTCLMVPPFTYSLNLCESIKTKGEIRYGKPPYGHAELSSIKIISKRMGLDPDKCMLKLKNNGIMVVNADQSLLEIAKTNNSIPKEIFRIINKKHGY